MGGPGACVLVRNPLTEQQSESLDAWLQSIISTRDNEDSNVYSFWLKDDVFPETVSNCLFYLAKDNPSDVAEDDMRQQLIEKLGYIPQRAISLGSGCNQDSDLDSPFKKIAADMHDKFGSLLPPHSEPSFEEISAFVQGMPGKVYEIYYETARETQWVYHIVDTTFLRAWLNHPHFHMIK